MKTTVSQQIYAKTKGRFNRLLWSQWTENINLLSAEYQNDVTKKLYNIRYFER